MVEAKAGTGTLVGMPDGAGDDSAKNARVKGEVGRTLSAKEKQKKLAQTEAAKH